MSERWDFDSIQWPDVQGFPLKDHLLLAMRRGSEAHGTYLPPTDPTSVDDRDVMAIVVPPLRYYLGLAHFEGAESIKGPWDCCVYEFRKFVRLLTKQNPNVVSMLWLRPEDYLYVHPLAQRLLDSRLLFRARQPAFDSFIGYAMGQFKRMTHFTFQGYMGAKRKALAEKYGYDCKNAAHLVRLLTMAAEYLSTGEMVVYREKDRQKIIDIKTGGWELEMVKVEAERLRRAAEDALATSPLPERVDLDAIDRLCCDILGAALAAPSGTGGTP